MARNLAILGLLVALVAVLSSREGRRPNGRGAALSCAAFVRARLPAPSTARFERSQQVKVGRQGGDWTVEGHVVADDSAGARAWTRYNCLLRADANNDWRLLQLWLTPYPR